MNSVSILYVTGVTEEDLEKVYKSRWKSAFIERVLNHHFHSWNFHHAPFFTVRYGVEDIGSHVPDQHNIVRESGVTTRSALPPLRKD